MDSMIGLSERSLHPRNFKGDRYNERKSYCVYGSHTSSREYLLGNRMMDLGALPFLFELLSSRFLKSDKEIRRLFHGRGCVYSGLEQITLDWLGCGILSIGVFKEQDLAFYDELTKQVSAFTHSDVWMKKGGVGILLQHRARAGAPIEVLFGEIPRYLNVVENGLTFKLELGQRQNNGLFLDMRLGRQWVLEHSLGKRVLNLFSYTCGFSVAAIEGGAKHVVNLDMAKSSLSRGKENHLLNQHDLKQVHFLGHELFKSWGKIKKYGPYDLMIIDPPSFQKGSFVLTKDYARILRRLPELLVEGGEVLACVNAPEIHPSFLLDQMSQCAPLFRFIERLENPPEFDDIDINKTLKVMYFKHSNDIQKRE